MLSEIVEKAEELTTFEGLKKNWALVSVAFIFMLAIYLRYLPEQGMQYLQALDPYMIFRLSQHLALEGNMPQTDFLRYFPYDAPTYLLNQGNIVLPAILYWLGPFLFFENYMEWAQFYPALLAGISVIFTYLFAKELWDKVAGVSCAFFLAVIAGSMHRTSAGFFEKEPVGSMFMMMSMYFFVRAWKYRENYSGILAGAALAFFTISWGGSQMLWLLYPVIVGSVMFVDGDIKSLITAYTPTVLVGSGLAEVLNPSRFHLTGDLFFLNMLVLGFLWSRYSVEEFEILGKDQLKYYVPVSTILGGILLLLSPLYSQYVSDQITNIIGKALRSSGGVIGGTVAENAGANLNQIISRFGAVAARQIHPTLGLLANVLGSWPLAYLGVAAMGTTTLMMLLRRYGFIEKEVERVTYYKAFTAILLLWLIGFAAYFQSSVILVTAPAVLLGLIFLATLYSLEVFDEKIQIEFKWYQVVPFIWAVANILTAASMSRLIFLASFPVAVSAGYMSSLVLNRLKEIDYEAIDPENAVQIKAGLIGAFVVLVFVINASSGFASTQRLGGSPNQLWMQNLDYMENQTERGDVILSWWDYGYWFQSIGRRASVADGSNAGYYSAEREKTNFPIADYFTSDDPYQNATLFEKHSVDYIVLDHTMLGKYAAVSQISNRDNSQFNSMFTMSSCQPQGNQCRTSTLEQSLVDNNGTALGTFNGRGLTVYVPLNPTPQRVEIDGPPTLEAQGQRGSIGCAITEDGVEEFDVEQPARIPGLGEVCVAEDPFYSFEASLQRDSQANIVIVPKRISEANLVKLYLMDGHGIDYVEKVEEGSNGFIKMWEVEEIDGQ